VHDRSQILRELGPSERLADDRNLILCATSRQYVGGVARGEHDLDAVAQPPRLARELDAADALRHHHVAELEVELFLALEHLNGLRAPGAQST
jgi:hypothetical protein